MPIYEYRCHQCGRSFDLFHSIGADPGPCPWCRGTVRRIYSSIGVIFKGSGFYSTDHRTTPKDEGAPKEAASDRKTPKDEGVPKEAASDRSSTPAKGTANEPTKGSTPDAKPS